MSDNKLNWVISIAVSVIVLVISVYFATANAHKFFMNGDLSFKHSLLENKCEKCHTPWEGIDNGSCLECHKERKHHKKTDTSKVSGDPAKTACYDCHREHQGKFHNIELVQDSSCKTCHQWGEHPPLDKTTLRVPADGTIIFTHESHYENEVYNEDSCDTCHLPPKAGGRFVSMTFDDACGTCHMIDNHTVEAEDTSSCPLCHLRSNYKVPPKNPVMSSVKYSHNSHSKFECKECHGEYSRFNEMEEPVEEATVTTEPYLTPSLPEISKCAGCHIEHLVSNDCASCHRFHPHQQPHT